MSLSEQWSYLGSRLVVLRSPAWRVNAQLRRAWCGDSDQRRPSGLLVFALVKSNDWGWASSRTVLLLVASAALLGAFVLIESRVSAPLVPLSIFHNRSLSVSNIVSVILGASIFSMFYFLSLYMQEVLGYSPLKTGIGFPSIAGAIIVAAGVAQVLVAKVGVRSVLAIGMLLAAGGLVYFSQITVHGTYVGTLLPGFLLAGTGLGLSFVPVTIGAVSGVNPNEAGVASGLITTTQQVGGALGVAVLSTIAISVTDHISRTNRHRNVSSGLWPDTRLFRCVLVRRRYWRRLTAAGDPYQIRGIIKSAREEQKVGVLIPEME